MERWAATFARRLTCSRRRPHPRRQGRRRRRYHRLHRRRSRSHRRPPRPSPRRHRPPRHRRPQSPTGAQPNGPKLNHRLALRVRPILTALRDRAGGRQAAMAPSCAALLVTLSVQPLWMPRTRRRLHQLQARPRRRAALWKISSARRRIRTTPSRRPASNSAALVTMSRPKCATPSHTSLSTARISTFGITTRHSFPRILS